MKLDTTLYFITDSTGFEKDEFLRRVRSALEGGVTIIQLREKNRTTREYIELAEAVHAITKEFNVPLIIDDRIDVMLASGAEGVHVGAEDMPVATARKLIGKDIQLFVIIKFICCEFPCRYIGNSQSCMISVYTDRSNIYVLFTG